MGLPTKSGPTRSNRSSDRSPVILRIDSFASESEGGDTFIRDLSPSGFLLETGSRLTPGDRISVEIPEIGSRAAKVVWARENLYGCSLEQRLPTAAVSAARLRSQFVGAGGSRTSQEASISEEAGAETFGQRLRRLRKARKTSIVEFAHLMGVSRPTVWYWEADKSVPRSSSMAAMARVLEVPESELRGGAANPGEAPDSGVEADPASLRNIVELAKEMVATAAGTSTHEVRITIEF